MSWKKINSKQLLKHPRIEVIEDTVILPNGKETTYVHFGETPDAAMVIAQDKNGKLFMQEEYSYPVDEWLLQFPGGMINKGESPEEGAAREFAEEAGMAGDLQHIGWYYPDNRRRKPKLHVFVATNLRKAIAVKDQEEEFRDHWFSTDEIKDLITTGKLINYSALAGWTLYMSKFSPTSSPRLSQHAVQDL